MEGSRKFSLRERTPRRKESWRRKRRRRKKDINYGTTPHLTTKGKGKGKKGGDGVGKRVYIYTSIYICIFAYTVNFFSNPFPLEYCDRPLTGPRQTQRGSPIRARLRVCLSAAGAQSGPPTLTCNLTNRSFQKIRWMPNQRIASFDVMSKGGAGSKPPD